MPDRIEYFAELESTNDYLSTLEAGFPKTIWAGFQTKGKGRAGHSWTAEAGAALLCSFGYEYDNTGLNSVDEFGLAPLVVGNVVCSVLTSVCKDAGFDAHFSVKWPNDIVAGDGKVAGILCETVQTGGKLRLIIGTGINITSAPDLVAGKNLTAKALAGLGPVKIEAEELLKKIQTELDFVFLTAAVPYNFTAAIDSLNERFWLRGKTIKGKDFQGMCTGFHSKTGALTVDTGSGIVATVDADFEILDSGDGS